MVDKVKATWEDILENKRMDVSGQGLDDDGVARLLKGLHMCAGCARGRVRVRRRLGRGTRAAAARRLGVGHRASRDADVSHSTSAQSDYIGCESSDYVIVGEVPLA